MGGDGANWSEYSDLVSEFPGVYTYAIDRKWLVVNRIPRPDGNDIKGVVTNEQNSIADVDSMGGILIMMEKDWKAKQWEIERGGEHIVVVMPWSWVVDGAERVQTAEQPPPEEYSPWPGWPA